MSARHLAMADIADIRARVEADYPDDPELLADMIEGETDLHEWLAWIEGKRLHDAEQLAGIDAVASDLAARKKRIKSRLDAFRQMGTEMLHLAGIGAVELPTATWSPTQVKPKRIVTDVDALPDDCVRIERKPDMKAINALPECPPGVTMDNGRQSVRVLTK